MSISEFTLRFDPATIKHLGLQMYSTLPPVNADAIGVEERDLKRHLDHDVDGRPYLWEVDEEIVEGSGWRVHGWIGALDRTAPALEGVESGITIMARGKLVQEPFVFEATVGQQFALSYM